MFEKHIEHLTRNDAPRWMVTKGGLDHGPFTGKEIIGMLLRGEVLETHDVQNLDEHVRQPAADYTAFRPFLMHYSQQAQKQAQSVNALKLIRETQKANIVKAGLIVTLLGAMGFGTWIFVTSLREHKEVDAQRRLADMYEKGSIRIVGSVGILPRSEKHHRGGKSHPRTTEKDHSPSHRGSFEDAMQQAVDMGDVTGEGSETQLSTQEIAGILNQKVGSFSGCVGAALRNGDHLGNVQIDLAIAGSGKVLGATVHQGGPEFQKCISQKVAAISFPKFGMPRMGARYSFSVN